MKTFLVTAFTLIMCCSCTGENEEQPAPSGGSTDNGEDSNTEQVFSLQNLVEGELISIIKAKNQEGDIILNILCEIEYGKVSPELPLPNKYEPNQLLSFRSSAGEYPNSHYFETAQFLKGDEKCTRISLKKEPEGDYYIESR